MISIRNGLQLVAGLALLVGCFDTAVAQNNSFQAVPSQLTFYIPQAGTLPAQSSATFSLSTTAGSTVQFSTAAPTWLTLNPASGSVSSTSQSLTATLSSAATTFQNGSYSGVITVTSTGGATVPPLAIPVTLNVGNQLTLAPSNVINLNYQSGQTPPTVSLNVSSTDGSLPFSITNIQPSASWLQPNAALNATTPGVVSVGINPNNLAPGNYSGTFMVSSTGANVTSQTVTVNLTVSQSPTLSASPQSLNFAFQTGTVSGALPSKTIALSTNGGPVGFAVDPSAQTWLSVASNGTVASQAQNATLTVTVNPNSPTALAPGTYNTNITVRTVGAAGNTQPITIPVSVLVSASPLLILGNPPAAFNYQIGGTAPADQTISIASSSSTTPVDYTVSDKPTWLDIAPGTGTTAVAGNLTLHVNTTALGALGAGTYSSTVTVRSTGAGNSPVSFPVTLNVGFTPSISTTIGGLTFNYQTTAGGQPAGQFFTVNSTGAPLPVGTPTFSSTTCGNNWVTVTTANNTTPATIFVNTANTTSITAPAICTGTISIPSGTSTPLTIPVTLNVSANPLLNVTSSDLSFTTPLGSSTVQQKTITLNGTDPNTPLNYNMTADQPWLSVNPASGRTDTAQTITVFINPAVFTQAGTYIGNVTVANQSANPAGSQPSQKLQVTVTVTSNVTLATNPQAVSITVPIGAQAVSQPLALTVSSGNAGFTATANSAQGWLKLSTSGTAPGPQVGGTVPATINVVADPTSVGLALGTYTGTITIVSPGLQNSPLTVNVSLTVSSAQAIALSVPNASFSTNVGATGNLTQTFNITSSGPPVNFTLTKGATGCDAISVSPASGTTGAAPVPVTITLNPAGLATGTIACTLTLAGPAGSGIQPQTFIVNVNVGAVLVPQVTAVVNAASFIPGPIAPGEVVTIFGVNIGPATLTNYILNQNNTFATNVGDTQVFFDTFAAPIIYVRNDQLSVVVPFEIAGRPSVNITIRRAGQTSASLAMLVVNYAPGIFTLNQQGNGEGALLNANGSVNGPGNAAVQGQAVSIFLTGAGLMALGNQTAGLSGTSPLPALPTNIPVNVSIGGQSAVVQYAGGAPGEITGLYQINAVVPTGIGTGPQTVAVSVGGAPAQGNVTVYVQ